MSRSACIVGKLEYREGDGANITIPPGPCEVVESALDATISWSEGEFHGSTAIPIADFRRFVSGHVIRFTDTKAS